MLLPRVLTAVIGLPLLLFLIHRGGLSFALFVVAVAILALYEYGVILFLGKRPAQRINTVIAGAALTVCQVLGGPLGPVLAALLTCVLLRELLSRVPSLDRAVLTLFGALFLGFMPAYLVLIRDLRPYGETVTLMFFIAVWVMDCAAYAVGKTMGRRQLAPSLSPRKTREGFIAGFAGAMAVVLGFRTLMPELFSVPKAVTLGLLIGSAGQLSDLAESMIKRAVNAKDSGALLPGHGGVMDRFDSFLLSAPLVYYFLLLAV